MQRILASVSCAAVLAAVAHAQCFEPNLGVIAPRGTFQPGTGDDVLFDPQPIGFAFPFGAATYTDAYFNSNGVIFLSNGAASPLPTATGWTTTPATQLDNLRGATATTAGNGTLPRIAPLWRDLVAVVGTGAVFVNNSIPGKFVVTWGNVRQFGTTTPFYTIQAQLLASGEIIFAYGPGTVSSGATIAGVSAANNIASVPGVDLSVGAVSTTDLHYQQFAANTLDLADTALSFVPNVGGGFIQTAAPCPGISVTVPPVASNVNYGTGCYAITFPPAADSFYQYETTATAGAAAFSNLSFTLAFAGTNYVAVPGGTYVPPSPGALQLTLTDDSATLTPSLSAAFVYPGPGGNVLTTSSLWVCSNGFVSPAAGNATTYTPSVATHLDSPQPAWRLWHDFNPAAAGSGKVKFEEIAGVAYVTWDGVYRFSGTTAADANTFQWQFELATGNVVFASQTLSPTGNTWLCGYSPAGASVDGGSQGIAASLPIVLLPPALLPVQPIAMSATPAPLSSPSSSNAVTFTVSNIPEFAPFSGLYGAAHMLSSVQVNPGLDLAFLGAPGCPLHIGSFDVTTLLVGFTPTQTLVVPVPIGLPPGTTAYTQAFGLITPNSLPNGENAAGLTSSNGIAHTVSVY